MTAFVTIVRHGQTAHNAERRFQGELPVPLDDVGRAQAARVARRLGGMQPRPTRVYASDMLRARETATVIAAELGLPVELEPQLREVRLGEWEGLLYDEVARLDPQGWARWQGRDIGSAPQGGETLRDVGVRMHDAYRRLCPQAEGEHVVLVSHGAAITALLCRLLDWDLAQTWGEGRALHQNTAVTNLQVDLKSAEVHPVLLACAAHLEEHLTHG